LGLRSLRDRTPPCLRTFTQQRQPDLGNPARVTGHSCGKGGGASELQREPISDIAQPDALTTHHGVRRHISPVMMPLKIAP